ncbi:serine/threonine-protein kinase PCRK1-like [Cynara cardunculus var. scolymus]|uniref:serine/threonine-protein kinase PCRK1-like n=1 Tax=Cynara cardunculus var. scolymus TaxID=59895 RepID=UPI000D627FFE|nr:serine/threonine-protein kinase PCRK1-like [Cynara cardunculus var. scolymus]
MKCFHFTNGDRRADGDDAVVSRSSARVSWARSLSVASSSVDTTRRSEFDADCNSRDFCDSVGFFEMLSQRRANDLRVFKFAELKSATKGFNRALMIGEGGFGCVYRGVVKAAETVAGGGNDTNGCLDVAIKQLNRNGFQGHKEWINEVNFLGVVNHPNLVKLVGYCAEDDERGIQRLLVYELMSNKSLEDHLLGRANSPLSWMTRLRIAQGAARGLAYLHEEMDFQLIFRDLKTSNILLDEDFNPKLSDFGLARQGPAAGLTHVSTVVVGTVGYAAPEYVQTGRLTAKSDVWSFGVVLYELITGRRAVERNLPRNEQKLLEWVKPYISDSKKFHLIVDPRLEGDYSLKSAHKLSSLANKCLTKNPKSRPKMSEVVEMLGNIIDDVLPPPEESEPETAEESEEGPDQFESGKEGGNYMRKVYEFKELVSLRNRSSGRLDWRCWMQGGR